jgi:hypothetical protein
MHVPCVVHLMVHCLRMYSTEQFIVGTVAFLWVS